MLAPPPGLVVGLEIDLPGIDDSIWASGQICYRKDDRLASGLGVRFMAMAKSQARMIRDFCIELAAQEPRLDCSRAFGRSHSPLDRL